MGEPLKNHYGPDVPRRIATMIRAVHPAFDTRAFVAGCVRGWSALELTPRMWRVADAFQRHLPAPYARAIEILVASLGAPHAGDELIGAGMAPFLYAPHVFFVARYGLAEADFERSMRAQYALTQRFTAEFSIRPFLERYPDRTLAVLRRWATDPNPHVRRLVSEGTRPLLPWAPRLRVFQRDPAPVLALLDLLKDDPAPLVRRSVANNLNDIGKDHPDLLAAVCRRWLKSAGAERRGLVEHALRSALKRGELGALAALGFGGAADVRVLLRCTPARPRIGGSVALTVTVTNRSARRVEALVDCRVRFVKARGGAAPKTFKLRRISLPPRGTLRLAKTVSLRQHTTRTHYPGRHRVDVVVNGRVLPVGSFVVVNGDPNSPVATPRRAAPASPRRA